MKKILSVLLVVALVALLFPNQQVQAQESPLAQVRCVPVAYHGNFQPRWELHVTVTNPCHRTFYLDAVRTYGVPEQALVQLIIERQNLWTGHKHLPVALWFHERSIEPEETLHLTLVYNYVPNWVIPTVDVYVGGSWLRVLPEY